MVTLELKAPEWQASDDNTLFPGHEVYGSTADGVRVEGMPFAVASNNEEAVCSFLLAGYTSGSITIKVHWMSDTGTANDVRWDVDQYAATPGDASDLRTRTFTNIGNVEDTAAGAGRPETTSGLSWSSSLPADGDQVFLRLRRTAPTGTEMTGDAIMRMVSLEWS